jgi:hypothetical protein
MILKLFIAMVVILVYSQCDSNTLNVIATGMLQSFKIFIVSAIEILLQLTCCDSKYFF